MRMEAILQQVSVCLWGPFLKPTSEQISSHYRYFELLLSLLLSTSFLKIIRLLTNSTTKTVGNIKNIWNTYCTQTLYFFVCFFFTNVQIGAGGVHIWRRAAEFMRSSWLAWNTRLGSKLCQVWRKNPDRLSPPWSPWKEPRPWGSHSRNNASPARKS